MQDFSSTPPYCQSFTPAVAAHRGASRRYPENSLAAIKEAINIGMEQPEMRYFIEADVRASADGQLVLLHDADVQRTTFGRGNVAEKSWAELKQLPLRPVKEVTNGHICPDRAHHPFFSVTEEDMRIASLPEVVALVKEANESRAQIGSPIGLALEVKPLNAVPVFPKIATRAAGLFSSFLSAVGLGGVENKVWPETPSVPSLTALLNQNAEAKGAVPMLVFSAAGQIGKRDLEQLWQGLSPKARQHFAALEQGSAPALANELVKSLVASAPHPVPVGDVSKARRLKNLQIDATGLIKSFWVVGKAGPADDCHPQGIPVISVSETLNGHDDIRAAIDSGVTLIACDFPERAMRLVKERFPVLSPYDAAMQQGNHVALQQERRQQLQHVQPVR